MRGPKNERSLRRQVAAAGVICDHEAHGHGAIVVSSREHMREEEHVRTRVAHVAVAMAFAEEHGDAMQPCEVARGNECRPRRPMPVLAGGWQHAAVVVTHWETDFLPPRGVGRQIPHDAMLC